MPKLRWKRAEWTNINSVNKKIQTFPRCEVCGKQLERKFYGTSEHKINGRVYIYERWENLARFYSRRTCGRELVNGKWKNTICSTFIGERAGNYKGIMPTCRDCGKKISYRSGGLTNTRCQRCWAISKIGIMPKGLEKFVPPRGIVPERLKPFVYKKLR